MLQNKFIISSNRFMLDNLIMLNYNKKASNSKLFEWRVTLIYRLYENIKSDEVITFSWGPSTLKRRSPTANTGKDKTKIQPPFAKIYTSDRLRYCNVAKMKNCKVLNGWVVNVKLSKSIWCFFWSSAEENSRTQTISRKYLRAT